MEEFVSFELRFGTCGVYLLLLEGRVVYAGKSTNVFARIGVHYQTMRRKQRGLHTYLNTADKTRLEVITFDEVRVKPCSKNDLDKEELALIQTYMPIHNVLHKRKPLVDVTSMEGFQRLMKTGRREPKMKRRKLKPNPTLVMRTKGVTLPKLKCLEDVL